MQSESGKVEQSEYPEYFIILAALLRWKNSTLECTQEDCGCPGSLLADLARRLEKEWPDTCEDSLRLALPAPPPAESPNCSCGAKHIHLANTLQLVVCSLCLKPVPNSQAALPAPLSKPEGK